MNRKERRALKKKDRSATQQPVLCEQRINTKGRCVIAIDFDGCLCSNAYPQIGKPNKTAIQRAIRAKQDGCALILWTNRTGALLQEAVDWCKKQGLIFDAVNENLPERIDRFGSDPRKICADVYWDDKARWTMASDFSQEALCRRGMNITVILEGPTGITAQTNAMLDTGATQSCIGSNLVQLLNLEKLQTTEILTMAGLVEVGQYAVNVSFPNLPIKKRTKLECAGTHVPNGQEKQNINLGLSFVIGWDLMRNWHITIDGPSGNIRIIDS